MSWLFFDANLSKTERTKVCIRLKQIPNAGPADLSASRYKQNASLDDAGPRRSILLAKSPKIRRINLRASLSCLLLCVFTVLAAWWSQAIVLAEEQDSSPGKSLLHSVLRVSFEEDKQLQTVTGELVAIDAMMGQLILDADGELTVIAPNALKRVEELSTPLIATPPKELAAKVLTLMPQGSRFIATDHFVVCYNTSEVYARWNSELYERLYKGFYRFWKEKGVELTPPRFPLIALVFESKADYIEYASKEFAGAQNTIGYYHQSTNRLASFDLTGIQGMMPPKAQLLRTELINQIVSRPEAERTIATIVHEACHQIAFNSGLQVRLGDNPLDRKSVCRERV